MKIFLTLLIALAGSLTALTQTLPKVYNLRQDWKVQEKEAFVRYADQRRNTIHFTVDKRGRGGKLLIYDRLEYSVFINGKLVARMQDSLHLKIDSLWAQYQGKLSFSIHQKRPVYSLQTLLMMPVANSYYDNPLRQGSYFKDFLILASFILITALVILFRVNSRLTLDYLNVVKLFSIQERDEAIVAGRIGSSVNLFFFGLISFLLGLLLLIIFHAVPDRVRLAGEFAFQSTSQVFLTWLLLSSVIFIILIIKLILIVSFSLLFGLRDTVRFQFFNFIRLLFVTTILMGGVALIYFIVQTQRPGYYYHLLTLGSVLVIMGTILLFMKLLARTSFPVFHLFSYLCATEVIPLMILGKVILF